MGEGHTPFQTNLGHVSRLYCFSGSVMGTFLRKGNREVRSIHYKVTIHRYRIPYDCRDCEDFLSTRNVDPSTDSVDPEQRPLLGDHAVRDMRCTNS